MSTRERVHTMVDRLTEEQLLALLVIFGNTGNDESEDMAKRKAAYEKMRSLIKPVDIPDEKEALAEYRRERYGI